MVMDLAHRAALLAARDKVWSSRAMGGGRSEETSSEEVSALCCQYGGGVLVFVVVIGVRVVVACAGRPSLGALLAESTAGDGPAPEAPVDWELRLGFSMHVLDA